MKKHDIYEDPDNSNKEELTDRDVRVLAISGIIMFGITAGMIFVKIDPRLGGLSLGLSIAASGLISYKDKEKKYTDQRLGSVYTIMWGIVFAALPFILHMMRTTSISGENGSPAEKYLVAVILLIMGISGIVFPFIAAKGQKDRCRYSTTAVCSSVTEKKRHDYTIYAAEWEYKVNNVTYTLCDRITFKPDQNRIGDKRGLLVNEDDPGEIYHDHSVSELICVLFSLPVIGAGIFLILNGAGIVGI